MVFICLLFRNLNGRERDGFGFSVPSICSGAIDLLLKFVPFAGEVADRLTLRQPAYFTIESTG